MELIDVAPVVLAILAVLFLLAVIFAVAMEKAHDWALDVEEPLQQQP